MATIMATTAISHVVDDAPLVNSTPTVLPVAVSGTLETNDTKANSSQAKIMQEKSHVLCGGQTAPSCAECPEGQGALRCNGECHWCNDKCTEICPPSNVSESRSSEHSSGVVTVSDWTNGSSVEADSPPICSFAQIVKKMTWPGLNATGCNVFTGKWAGGYLGITENELVHFFCVWLGTPRQFQVSTKFRYSLQSFSKIYPNETITIVTVAEADVALDGLVEAGLIFRNETTVATWGGGALQVITVDIEQVVVAMASEIGIDSESVLRRLKTPYFQAIVAQADMLRLSVGIFRGGFYFDTDLIHIRRWPDASLQQRRVVMGGDPGCPSDPYYYVPCVTLHNWSYWLPDNRMTELIPPAPTYLVNGIFNFPTAGDNFLREAARFCLGNDHGLNHSCWSCCGPRAFSTALKSEVAQPHHQQHHLNILPVRGVLYCEESALQKIELQKMYQKCFSIHAFGGANGPWSPDPGSALGMHLGVGESATVNLTSEGGSRQ